MLNSLTVGSCTVKPTDSARFLDIIILPDLSVKQYISSVITFCASRRRRKMYCGHARLSVCVSAAVRPHYCTDLDVTWRRGRGCPLVVRYWADLQSMHGLRCYGNITRTLVTSLRPSRDMTTLCERSAGCARAADR